MRGSIRLQRGKHYYADEVALRLTTCARIVISIPGAAVPVFAYFIIPCILSQRAKASNHPVLVVSFGYIPKPWPPCSYRWNSTGRFAAFQLSMMPYPPLPKNG